MNISNLMTLLMLVLATSCGDLKNAAPWMKGEELELQEASLLEPVTYTLQSPQQAGGTWKRVLQLALDADLSYWSVEKRGSTNEPWVAVGFTNSEGVFIDENIDAPSQYRVASRFESPLFESVRDEVLEGNLCAAGKGDIRLKGHRMIVPKGQEAYADGCSLFLEANEMVIEGELRSFASTSRQGRDAKSLQILASHVSGSGKIIWKGEDGAHGMAGANGKDGASANASYSVFDGENGGDGQNGQDGQAGGNGGYVLAQVPDMKIWLEVGGGAGGLGGAAGQGGKGGKNACGFHPDLDRRICGSHGKDGKNGVPGKNGDDGKGGSIVQI